MRKIATKDDRKLIAADMNKVAEDLRHVEDYLSKFDGDYSKISTEDRKVVAADLTKIAEDMSYIEKQAKDLGLYDEIVSYVKEATAVEEKEARKKIASDLYDVADELEIAEKRLARNRISKEDYDKIASGIAERLNKIADLADEFGIEISSADDDEEKESKECAKEDDDKEKESSSYIPLSEK